MVQSWRKAGCAVIAGHYSWDNGKAHLNLASCEGLWSNNTQTYS
jgi:hypothetical protein